MHFFHALAFGLFLAQSQLGGASPVAGGLVRALVHIEIAEQAYSRYTQVPLPIATATTTQGGVHADGRGGYNKRATSTTTTVATKVGAQPLGRGGYNKREPVITVLPITTTKAGGFQAEGRGGYNKE